MEDVDPIAGDEVVLKEPKDFKKMSDEELSAWIDNKKAQIQQAEEEGDAESKKIYESGLKKATEIQDARAGVEQPMEEEINPEENPIQANPGQPNAPRTEPLPETPEDVEPSDDDPEKIIDAGEVIIEAEEAPTGEGEVTEDSYQKGIDIESKEHPDLSPKDIIKLVKDHMIEDPYYYDKEEEVSTEAGPQLPPGAKSVSDPSQVPKGWRVIKGPKGGTYAVPPAGGAGGDQKPSEEPKGEVPDNKQDARYDSIAQALYGKDAKDLTDQELDAVQEYDPTTTSNVTINDGESVIGDKVYSGTDEVEIKAIDENNQMVVVQDSSGEYSVKDGKELTKASDDSGSFEGDEKGFADAVSKFTDAEVTDVRTMNDFAVDYAEVETNEGTYMVFNSDEDAEHFATQRVLDDLKNEPELFNQDWLAGHVDEEAAKNDIALGIENDSGFYDQFVEEEQPKTDEDYDKFADWAKEKADQIVDNDEYSEYGFDKLSYIDEEAAAKDAIATDGVAHFLSTYDGEENESDGKILYRTEKTCEDCSKKEGEETPGKPDGTGPNPECPMKKEENFVMVDGVMTRLG